MQISENILVDWIHCRTKSVKWYKYTYWLVFLLFHFSFLPR